MCTPRCRACPPPPTPRQAQRAPDVALEKVVARTGVEQHEHAPTLFHLLFDGIDLHLAEERVLVSGLEARQLLGRRFHRCWLSFLKSRGCRSVASAAVYGRGPCGTPRPDGSRPGRHRGAESLSTTRTPRGGEKTNP